MKRGAAPALLLSLLLALLLAPAIAWGHGAPPAAQSVFYVDEEWVFVTNFGVMTPAFADEYVCEEAFFGSDRFRVLPLTQDAWVTFTRSRVALSQDGCDFQVVHDLPGAPTDVAMDPAAQEVIFTVQNEGDAELWRSQDGGASWTLVPVDTGGVRPAGLGLPWPGTAALIAYEIEEARRGEALLWIVDLSTGAVEEIPLEEGLLYPNLLDARDGQVLWHGRRGEVHEIFWMTTAGEAIGRYESPRWPTAGAIGPDAIYLGGVDEENRGVFRASSQTPDQLEEIIAGHRALCMAAAEGEVIVCGHRNHDDHDLLRWSAGQVDEAGPAEVLVDFRELQGIRSDCPAGTLVAEVCPAVWPETARALGITIAGDEENGSNGELDVPEERESRAEEGCAGCAATGGGPPGSMALLGLVIASLMLRRGRREEAPWPT